MKPFFTLSKSVVLQQYAKARELADLVSYSSKTNPLVTPLLEEETDSLFSIHLVNELKHVKDKSRVVFLAQAWNADLIKELIDSGVKTFIVDNASDLSVLTDFLKGFDGKVNLLLRIKLKENTLRTERFFVFGMASAKVNAHLIELRKNKAIGELGVHFHRKTQNVSEWNLKYELSNILTDEALESIDLVNMGGGLPSEYANTNLKVLKSVFSRIAEFKAWLNSKKIKLVIEPGRFIAAPAGRLVTRVIGVHENNVVVNASVYNSDLDALIVPVKLLVEGEGEGKPYAIKGVTPCSVDLFRYKVLLKDVKVGDEIVFLNAGAYNFSTDFCDLEKLETRIID